MRMLDLAENLDPVVLALLPDREARLGEIGVVERAERNGDEPVELAVDFVVNVRSAVGTEVKRNAIAAVGDVHVSFRPAFDCDTLRRPARLDREAAARALFAV